jgi:hypothetical protein
MPNPDLRRVETRRSQVSVRVMMWRKSEIVEAVHRI